MKTSSYHLLQNQGSARYCTVQGEMNNCSQVEVGETYAVTSASIKVSTFYKTFFWTAGLVNLLTQRRRNSIIVF